jgi:hypothetical protein
MSRLRLVRAACGRASTAMLNAEHAEAHKCACYTQRRADRARADTNTLLTEDGRRVSGLRRRRRGGERTSKLVLKRAGADSPLLVYKLPMAFCQHSMYLKVLYVVHGGQLTSWRGWRAGEGHFQVSWREIGHGWPGWQLAGWRPSWRHFGCGWRGWRGWRQPAMSP